MKHLKRKEKTPSLQLYSLIRVKRNDCMWPWRCRTVWFPQNSQLPHLRSMSEHLHRSHVPWPNTSQSVHTDLPALGCSWLFWKAWNKKKKKSAPGRDGQVSLGFKHRPGDWQNTFFPSIPKYISACFKNRYWTTRAAILSVLRSGTRISLGRTGLCLCSPGSVTLRFHVRSVLQMTCSAISTQVLEPEMCYASCT